MTSRKTAALSAVVWIAFGAATALQAQERMRTGMWENTVTAASGQTATRSHCFKPSDAVMSNGTSEAIRAETEKSLSKTTCTLKDFTLTNDTLTEIMVCGATTIHQETKFHGGDSFDTTTTSTGSGVSNITHIKGRRTGDCKAGSD